MREKLSTNSRLFVVNFAVENFKLVVYDSYGAQIHTEGRSILFIKSYTVKHVFDKLCETHFGFVNF